MCSLAVSTLDSIVACTQQAMHVSVEQFTTEIIMLNDRHCNIVSVCVLDVCILV